MRESVAHWTIALAFSMTEFTAEKRLSHFVSHQAPGRVIRENLLMSDLYSFRRSGLLAIKL